MQASQLQPVVMLLFHSLQFMCVSWPVPYCYSCKKQLVRPVSRRMSFGVNMMVSVYAIRTSQPVSLTFMPTRLLRTLFLYLLLLPNWVHMPVSNPGINAALDACGKDGCWQDATRIPSEDFVNVCGPSHLQMDDKWSKRNQRHRS